MTNNYASSGMEKQQKGIKTKNSGYSREIQTKLWHFQNNLLIKKLRQCYFRNNCWKVYVGNGHEGLGVKPWIIIVRDFDFSSELENVLNGQFNTNCSCVCCNNITYIGTINNFIYLNSIMDFFSRIQKVNSVINITKYVTPSR